MSRDAVDFDWKPENDSVLVHSQPSLAVYENRWSQVVVRQERGELDDHDPYIVVNVETVPLLVERLQFVAAQASRREPGDLTADIVEFPRSTRVAAKSDGSAEVTA